VATELAAEETRIQRAVDLLRAVAGPVSPTSLVRAASLDLIIVALLEMAGKDLEDIPESVYRLLGSCVRQVTMPGLAASNSQDTANVRERGQIQACFRKDVV